ncbi:MAG: prolyl oligopeptidase family serine peptidase, partial [Ilumatobacter sp.]
PDDFDVRTRVHEYGGGALGAGHGVVLACRWDDQRVHLIDGDEVRAVTPEPIAHHGIRWAAMTVLHGGAAFVAVRETHGADRLHPNVNVHGDDEAVNELVHVDLVSGECSVLVSGPDFVGGPWVNHGGSRIAWLQWNHPHMPWDAAELWIADLAGGAIAGAARVAGGTGSAVCDAAWDGDDRLVFCDDPSGWWNVYAWTPDGIERLQDEAVESGIPRWVSGDGCLAVVGSSPDGDRPADVFAATADRGSTHLRHIGVGEIPLAGVASISNPMAYGSDVVAVVGGPTIANAVVRIDPASGEWTPLSDAVPVPDGATGSVPVPITFGTPDGAVAHALHYPPASDTHVGPDDERPPLVVLSHGGPTSAARTSIHLTAQYWASRGFAVVDVDYRGSVGYGREFRDALRHHWGIHDVTDCVAAAQHLVERGLAHSDRLIIEGGSAGGYTTLLALCTTNVFAAGGDMFGVSDLRALATDTHKFESRYLDSMIGEWPAEEPTYVERSPLSHVATLTTPIIVLQGDEDEVVPPSQSEVIVDAMRAGGIAHAYLLFAGEQHGFRKPENIVRGVEARLAFYGRILGFEPFDQVELPEFVPGR